MALWLERSSSDRAVLLRSLADDTELCFWARQFTLTVRHSTQVYKWTPANLKLQVTLRWTGMQSSLLYLTTQIRVTCNFSVPVEKI